MSITEGVNVSRVEVGREHRTCHGPPPPNIDLGYPPTPSTDATKIRMVGKREGRILLECFLVR